MKLSSLTAFSLILAAASSSPLLAQPGPGFNRKLDQVGITPTSQPGMYDIHVIWSAGIGPTSAPMDLSTDAYVFINGTEVPTAILSTDVQIDGGSGFCGGGPPCSGGCGSGYIDGITAAAFLCIDCSCQLPPLTSTLPNQPLESGDQITVLLFASPGSVPDGDTSDDVRSMTFSEPSFWDRGIVSVELTPSPGAPDSFFDVFVNGKTEWTGLGEAVDLDAELQLLLNGTVVATQLLAGSSSPASGGDISCGGVGCGGLCGWWNGLQVNCDESFWHFGCLCGGGWISAFPGVGMEPGDVVSVKLKPAPGALPELPPFDENEGNDEGGGEVPNPCPADVNGDGAVNVQDVVEIILNWGCVDPEGNCPGDVNNSGVVDVQDLVEALLAWGVCFPV